MLAVLLAMPNAPFGHSKSTVIAIFAIATQSLEQLVAGSIAETRFGTVFLERR
jgi:hypothetical protein